mmetsp:Transcript_25927/g.29005  ORF Transcript_25927/g.29005 Transcript_25927/m.29005 type:complete len:92 (+) Transcript_25927:354-629(+)
MATTRRNWRRRRFIGKKTEHNRGTDSSAMIVIIFSFSNVPTCASCVSLSLLYRKIVKKIKINKNEREKECTKRRRNEGSCRCDSPKKNEEE